MLRELLRRSFQVVMSSATACAEDRLSKLESRISDLECRQTEFETDLRSEMQCCKSEVREWVGVEGHRADW